jgi:hypothetical protein
MIGIVSKNIVLTFIKNVAQISRSDFQLCLFSPAENKNPESR